MKIFQLPSTGTQNEAAGKEVKIINVHSFDKSKLISLCAVLIVSIASFIGAAYALATFTSNNMDEIDFIEDDIYIVSDSSFRFNTEIVRVLWDTETDDNSTGSNGITYTNGRFVNQDGNKITTYTSKIGSIAVYDKNTLMTGISEKLSGTFNSNSMTKTNASTNCEVLIRDSSTPGHYDVYVKFTLTNDIVRGTDYALPGGNISITYNP